MLRLFSLFGRGTLGSFHLPHFNARSDVGFSVPPLFQVESGKSGRCRPQHRQSVTAADDGTALGSRPLNGTQANLPTNRSHDRMDGWIDFGMMDDDE